MTEKQIIDKMARAIERYIKAVEAGEIIDQFDDLKKVLLLAKK